MNPFSLNVIRLMSVLTTCTIMVGLSLSSYGQISREDSKLSLSIFLDNYDIWSNEIIKKNTLSAVDVVAPLNQELTELREQGKLLSREADDVLNRIAFSRSPNAASLEAAIALSQRKTGAERRDALLQAHLIAKSIRPRSEDVLATLVLLAQNHLEQLDFVAASKLRSEISKAISDVGQNQSSLHCTALGVLADISFSLNEFEEAAANYEKAALCVSDNKNSLTSGVSRVALRRACTSYRLTRYDDTLRFLEAATPQLASESAEIQEALSADISKILGVSLAETSPAVPSFHWVRNAQEYRWVGQGLVNSILYLARAGQTDLGMRWFFYLEPFLRASLSAPEFYSVGIEVLKKNGRFDQLNDLRMRAIAALRADGAFALSMGGSALLNQRRSAMVLAESKEIFEYFSALRPEVVGKQAQLRFAEVTESFLAERFNACSETKSLTQAHRFLALSGNLALADKLKAIADSCQMEEVERADMALENLEMHRLAWKRSNKSESAWINYKERIHASLSSHVSQFGIRSIALEAATDAVASKRFSDAETVADSIFSTNKLLESIENRQFETEALVALIVNLLAHNPFSISIERLAWDVHGALLPSFGRLNKFVMEIEQAIGSSVYAQDLAMRRDGSLGKAFEILWRASSRLGSQSVVGRDLGFMAVRLSCGIGMHLQCVSSASSIINNPSSNSTDQYFSSRWKGRSLWQNGSFLKAAESLLKGARTALQASLNEQSALIIEDLKLAGLIFTDLMLWERAIEVRGLIKKSSQFFALRDQAQPEIVAWAVEALKARAFEVAAELSSGLYSESGVSSSKSGPFELYTRLLSSYARVRSNLESEENLNSRMREWVARGAKDKNFSRLNAVEGVSFSNLIQDVSRFRRKQILDRYSGGIADVKSAELKDRLDLFRKDMSDYQLYCNKSVIDAGFAKVSDESCAPRFARAMLRYSTALRSAYHRALVVDGSQLDPQFVVGLDGAVVQLRSMLGASFNGSGGRGNSGLSVYEHRSASGMALLGSELSR
jgi:tetratricopeptide (TPR) repeat protein